jgi:hypothetical protein
VRRRSTFRAPLEFAIYIRKEKEIAGPEGGVRAVKLGFRQHVEGEREMHCHVLVFRESRVGHGVASEECCGGAQGDEEQCHGNAIQERGWQYERTQEVVGDGDEDAALP